ncbi:hypothetical protein [Nocardia sp. NPDC024068]|uniref:hypothetical protein n=1 Tax=Nocardia sp. NPDC024068 TaxID=3157197 RepID=UPI00340021D7
MTNQPKPVRREPHPIVTAAAEQLRSPRGRRTRKDLHEPCTDQLPLFDPPDPENLK